jgi:hypothetical protein
MIPALVSNYETHALSLISKHLFQEAFLHLKQCESLLESLSTQGGYIKKHLIISVLNNIAFTLTQYLTFRLQDLKKAENYFDACFFNARSSEFLPKFTENQDLSISTLNFVSKLSLQYTSLLLKQNKFLKALEVLQISEKLSGLCIKNTSKAVQRKITKINEKLKKSGKIVLLKRAAPVLEEVSGFVDKKVMKKMKMRSMLGLLNFPDWTFDLEFESFYQGSTSQACNLIRASGIYAEISKDSIWEKVLNYLTSLFFTGLAMKGAGKIDFLKVFRFAETLSLNFFDSQSKVVERIRKECQVNRVKIGKVIKRNLSFVAKKENCSKEAKTKAVYSGCREEIKRIRSGKIRKNRSESMGVFKEIQTGISFNKKKSELQ